MSCRDHPLALASTEVPSGQPCCCSPARHSGQRCQQPIVGMCGPLPTLLHSERTGSPRSHALAEQQTTRSHAVELLSPSLLGPWTQHITGRKSCRGGVGHRTSSSIPSPQPSSCQILLSFLVAPDTNHMVSYPSYLQHPSSYSNVSQNCALSVSLPNPSKH